MDNNKYTFPPNGPAISPEQIQEVRQLIAEIASGRQQATVHDGSDFLAKPTTVPYGADDIASGLIPSNVIHVVANSGHVLTFVADEGLSLQYSSLAGVRTPNGEVLNGKNRKFYQVERAMFPIDIARSFSQAVGHEFTTALCDKARDWRKTWESGGTQKQAEVKAAIEKSFREFPGKDSTKIPTKVALTAYVVGTGKWEKFVQEARAHQRTLALRLPTGNQRVLGRGGFER